MAASRVSHPAVYNSDIFGAPFRTRVDDHFFTQAALGWAAPIGGEAPLSGRIRTRHAVGVDASGRQHSVRVADITATLWTAPTTTAFDILDDTGALQSCTVTGLVGEAVTFN